MFKNIILLINRKNIETSYHLFVMISVVAAVATFYYQVRKDVDAKIADSKFKWKQEIVYSIIKDYEWTSFQTIKDDYLKFVQQENLVVLVKDDMQDSTLKSILFDLTMRKMIDIRPDRTYSISPGASLMQENFLRQQDNVFASQYIDEKITSFLVTESCKYSIDDVLVKLKENDPELSNNLFYMSISNSLSSSHIYLDAKNKLCSNLKRTKNN